MLTFEPFRLFAVKNKIKKTELTVKCGFGSKTSAKIWNDHFPVRSDTIDKLCQTYNLRVDQVIMFKKEVE